MLTASPQLFDFRSSLNKSTGDLDLECTVLAVHPIPRMLFSQLDSADGHTSREVTNGVRRHVQLNRTTLLYDVQMRYTITAAALRKVAASTHSMSFECGIEIDRAAVSRKKRISIQNFQRRSFLTSGAPAARRHQHQTLPLAVLTVIVTFMSRTIFTV